MGKKWYKVVKARWVMGKKWYKVVKARWVTGFLKKVFGAKEVIIDPADLLLRDEVGTDVRYLASWR
jgi:hypothetical protein